MSEHTAPRPWRVTKWMNSTVIHDANNRVVCSMTSKDRDERAAQIMSAVNSHDMMLELLRAIDADPISVAPVRDWAARYGVDLSKANNHRVIDVAIEAAIAKAEAEQP